MAYSEISNLCLGGVEYEIVHWKNQKNPFYVIIMVK